MSQPNISLFREVWQTAFRAEVTSVVSRGNATSPFGNPVPPDPGVVVPATFSTNPLEPASFFDDWNLSVGASNREGTLKNWIDPFDPDPSPDDPFSSYYSRSVDLIAPGVRFMLETTNEQGGYSNFNGTSAAAPHVTGAAALLMSYSDVPLAPEDVEHLLQYGAVPKNSPDTAGWGLLDVYASLKLIEKPEYRVMHFDTVLTSGAMMASPGTIPIYLTSDYDTIQAGLYAAQPYQYVANFSYNLGTGVSLAALPPGKPPYWVRTVLRAFGDPMAFWSAEVVSLWFRWIRLIFLVPLRPAVLVFLATITRFFSVPLSQWSFLMGPTPVLNWAFPCWLTIQRALPLIWRMSFQQLIWD